MSNEICGDWWGSSRSDWGSEILDQYVIVSVPNIDVINVSRKIKNKHYKRVFLWKIWKTPVNMNKNITLFLRGFDVFTKSIITDIKRVVSKLINIQDPIY